MIGIETQTCLYIGLEAAYQLHLDTLGEYSVYMGINRFLDS